MATLPDSKFAPWQLARLPTELSESLLVDSAGWQDGVVTRHPDEPANTIVANHSRRPMRAFLIGGANTSDVQAAPGVGVSQPDEPARAVTCSNSLAWRAVLVGGQYARPANERDEARPVQTRDPEEPAFTVTAQNKGDWRGRLAPGRIVQMTPRALARFQSFPDFYRLSGHRRLDCKIVGMAVPPLLYEKLVGQLTRSTGGTR